MTWVASAVDSRFGVENLPYGVFSTANDATHRLGVRIGDEVLDLRRVAESGQGANCPTCSALRAPALNAFMARGREVWTTVRGQVQSVLTDPEMEQHLRPMLT